MRRRTFLILFAFAVFLPIVSQFPTICVGEQTAKEKTLQFLSDVVMLDVPRYNATLRNYEVTYVSDLGGAKQEEVRYILQDQNSLLDATCVFLNGIYSNCLLSWRSGSPNYAQPQPANLVDIAKVVLDRYQRFVGSENHHLRTMLNLVSKAENTTVTSGNYRLNVIVYNDRNVGFVWSYAVDGAETIALNIKLHDKSLYFIAGDSGLFTFSNAEVKVSNETAINIAIEQTMSITWNVKDANGTEQTVHPEGLATNATPTASLFLTVHPTRDPFTYYPCWKIDVWLDKTYPGGIFFVEVLLWADTGEVFYRSALGGGGGGPPPDQPANPTTQPSPTPHPNNTPITSSPEPTAQPTSQPSTTSTPTDASASLPPQQTETPSTSVAPTGSVIPNVTSLPSQKPSVTARPADEDSPAVNQPPSATAITVLACTLFAAVAALLAALTLKRRRDRKSS